MSISADPPRSPLVFPRVSAPPRAAVLLLHGGREHGTSTPPAWNLPSLRMRPFARAIRRAFGARGIVVGEVRYRCRGWNGEREDAAHDARRALDALAPRIGDAPVVLVGHSMGARAALRAADHPSVRAVVGLAPWCPPGEPVGHLRGRGVVLLHGDRDRTTDPAESREYVARAAAAGADATLVTMPGSDHAMLRAASAWHALTTATVGGLLHLGPLPEEVSRGLERRPAG
ncbi:alpha/beta fold hydrolase [Streptomyces sp. NPDC029674]|uniref:alpha/beta fold hydrolase n=1 Tax=Streptomyces sp. NPDC029674 TaxID=3365297 RepID=UPI00384E34C5